MKLYYWLMGWLARKMGRNTKYIECDLYFIKCLRKFVINQVADFKRREIHDKAKARLAAEEEAKKAKLSVVENNPAEVSAQPMGASNGKEILSNT